MKLPLLFITCALATAGLAQKPSVQEEQAVWDTEYAWNQAMLHRDADALAKLEHENFVRTTWDGIVANRTKDLADAKAGDSTYQEYSEHEAQVRIVGDTAVVTGRTVVAGTSNGQPVQGIFQFTNTLVRQGEQWKAAASQMTRLSPTAATVLEPLPRDLAWVKRHEGFVEIAKKGGVDLLFLGDSITDNWRQPERGLPVWEKNYGASHAANFGIGGDRVQHVLWRIRNGELDGISPRALVLMIGTNNTGLERDKHTPRNRPPEVIQGVENLVNEIAVKLPKTQLLLLAIFPRGETRDDPARLQVAEINQAISRLDDGKRIHFLDIGSVFLEPNGSISKEIMPDFLHPTRKGYERWAEAIKEPLAKLLKE